MNVELLLKVKEQILKEPPLFDMTTWSAKTPCGTSHCIGGWALSLYEGVDKNIPYEEALEIAWTEAGRLFYKDSWPDGLRTDYYLASTDDQRAEVAARRIDLFIATNGEK